MGSGSGARVTTPKTMSPTCDYSEDYVADIWAKVADYYCGMWNLATCWGKN